MENEIKMAAEPNCQIKYKDAHDRELVIDKFLCLCKLLGMEIGEIQHHKINDNYWDDTQASLYNRNMAVRTRKEDDKYYYTLKMPKNEFSLGLLRDECEDEIGSPAFHYSGINECKTLLKQKLGLDAHFISSDLHNSLNVSNDRTSFNVKTKENNSYLVCFDCFYFSTNSHGFKRYSDNYFEIEIENKNKDLSFDDSIISLINAINRLFSFAQHENTKYGRAYSWANSTEHVESYIFLMTDIVSYSKVPATLQKQMIKQLNFITKKCLKQNGLVLETDYFYNSTGDGYILIIKKEYIKKIIPILKTIYSEVRSYDESNEDEQAFGVRFGLNYGSAFIYYDMKENMNFAGEGINIAARITNLGNSGHILVSTPFYNYARDCGCDISNFIFAGEYKVKHNVSVNVFNYFSSDNMIGNSDDITLITKDIKINGEN
jgi:hypothetical protein